MDLSDFFKTKSQASEFSKHLSTILKNIYTTNFDLEKALIHELGLMKKDSFMKLLHAEKISIQSIQDIAKFLQMILDMIPSLSVVTLTIAFEPTEDSLQAFSQWFLMSTKKQVVFDIQIDYKLLAGATITYNGKFKDYSIKPFFDKLIHPFDSAQGYKPTDSAQGYQQSNQGYQQSHTIIHATK